MHENHEQEEKLKTFFFRVFSDFRGSILFRSIASKTSIDAIEDAI